MKNLFSGYVNLLKTAVGSGILSYPFLFYSYGTLPIILLSFIASIFSFLGLVFYLVCNRQIEGQSSIKKLATRLFPNANIIADSAMCFKCIGVSISYLIIIRQLLPLVLIYAFGSHFFTKQPISLFIFLLITSPLSFFKKLDKLKYTSILGLLCIFTVILTTFYRIKNTESLKQEEMKLVAPLGILWFTGLGKIVFSFTCHQNIFTVQNESQEHSTKKLIFLCFFTMLTAFFVYILFGYTNYLLLGKSVKDNVLEGYPKDNLSVIVQSLYVIAMGFSYPLQINPCRLYMIELFNLKYQKEFYNEITHILTTLFLLIITYTVAISGLQLGTVYSLIGATASSLMCLILPGFFYLKICKEKNRNLSVCAGISVFFGIFVFLSAASNIFLFK
ncbi:hypothetical protein GVAV_002353 [Gurleya vavrai]